jgi:NAD(P)-dependent dehydrogenase (short-subunit alcohol dehydrogenase family)
VVETGKHQVALVTGGGRGVGRALALALPAEGAAVAVVSRTRSELYSVAKAPTSSGCADHTSTTTGSTIGRRRRRS